MRVILSKLISKVLRNLHLLNSIEIVKKHQSVKSRLVGEVANMALNNLSMTRKRIFQE